MNRSLRRFIQLILRTGLWAGSLLILLVMLIQIGLACAFLWLGSAGGKNWIDKQVQTALAGSGYTIAYQNVFYESVGGVSVVGLSVSDRDGEMFSADNISLNVAWLPLLGRELDLTVNGGALALNHLPSSGEPKADTAAQSFKIPDLYFHRITINYIHADKVMIGQNVMGQAMVLSPSLSGDIKLSDKVDGRMRLALDQIEGTDIAWLPNAVVLDGVFDSADMAFNLKQLAVKSSSYNVDGTGVAALNGSAPVDMTINIAVDHLGKLAGTPGSLKAKAVLSGTADAPVLRAEGALSLDLLKEKGLSDLEFNLNVPNLRDTSQGSVDLTATYKDKPAKISADILYNDPQIKIANITGALPDLDIKGEVVIDRQTMLATGNLNADAANFSTYADLVGGKVEGRGMVSVTLDHPQQSQAAKINVAAGNIRYDDYKIASLKAAATLANVNNPWPNDVDLSVAGFVTGSVHVKSLTATLKQKEGGGHYLLTLSTQGNAGQPFQVDGRADLNNLDQLHPDLSNINLVLKSAGNALTLTGGIDQKNLDLKAAAKNFSLRGLPVDLPDAANDFSLTGTVALNGPLAAPLANVDLHINNRAAKGKIPVIDLAMLADYKDKVMSASLTGTGKGITTMKGNLSLPVDFALQPFRFDMPPSRVMEGAVMLRGDSAAMLQALLPTGTSISGVIDGQAKITGTMQSPEIDGIFNFTKGAIRDEGTGIALNALNLNSTFTRDLFRLQQFNAMDNADGIIRGKGQLGFGSNKSGQLDFTLARFHAMHSEMADVILSGTLGLTGQKNQFVLSGSIDPAQTAITIPERLQNPIPQLNIVKPGESSSKVGQVFSLDIKVAATNRVFVRGWGLDAEFGGTVAVTGTLDQPLMDGSLSSIRGRYNEFGRRFSLDHANLRFQGTVPPSPYMDIKADLAASDIVASVLITGPSKSPVLSFVSTPAMPQDEVLSRVLFGKNMSSISPFQAIQLEQSLQRFSGKGSSGLDPLGALRSATGLDDISVDSTEGGGATVGAGKYVTDKIYIGVQRGKSETSGAANIKVDVTPNIAVDSKIGQDAQGGAGVSWHWDY